MSKVHKDDDDNVHIVQKVILILSEIIGFGYRQAFVFLGRSQASMASKFFLFCRVLIPMINSDMLFIQRIWILGSNKDNSAKKGPWFSLHCQTT